MLFRGIFSEYFHFGNFLFIFNIKPHFILSVKCMSVVLAKILFDTHPVFPKQSEEDYVARSINL